tara:strand:- start:2753 stop:4132 length:1380 start_codon:yes stop_codon:yes gene_type:complete
MSISNDDFERLCALGAMCIDGKQKKNRKYRPSKEGHPYKDESKELYDKIIKWESNHNGQFFRWFPLVPEVWDLLQRVNMDEQLKFTSRNDDTLFSVAANVFKSIIKYTIRVGVNHARTWTNADARMALILYRGKPAYSPEHFGIIRRAIEDVDRYIEEDKDAWPSDAKVFFKRTLFELKRIEGKDGCNNDDDCISTSLPEFDTELHFVYNNESTSSDLVSSPSNQENQENKEEVIIISDSDDDIEEPTMKYRNGDTYTANPGRGLFKGKGEYRWNEPGQSYEDGPTLRAFFNGTEIPKKKSTEFSYKPDYFSDKFNCTIRHKEKFDDCEIKAFIRKMDNILQHSRGDYWQSDVDGKNNDVWQYYEEVPLEHPDDSYPYGLSAMTTFQLVDTQGPLSIISREYFAEVQNTKVAIHIVLAGSGQEEGAYHIKPQNLTPDEATEAIKIVNDALDKYIKTSIN